MMTRTILLFLGLLFSVWGYSQSVSPEVIATAGEHFTGTNAQVSWTIGETVIQTFTNGSHQLTQGFHQSNLMITSVEDLAENIHVKVFPNPTTERVNIEWSDPIEGADATLYNLTGKQLLTQKVLNQTMTIDLSIYSAGTYFLHLKNEERKTIKTFKILKIK